MLGVEIAVEDSVPLGGRVGPCLVLIVRGAVAMALIPGTSSVAHLRENVAAADLALPAEAIAELDAAGR